MEREKKNILILDSSIFGSLAKFLGEHFWTFARIKVSASS
jgi:hypothetical protein